MKLSQFLEHHGIARNPFADEDAQTDPVFKDHCIESTFHPSWDKIYGDPGEPATSIVFGEKGSGKTALRLQVVRHIEAYNRAHPEGRLFVVEYDDFNPFLDRFRDRLTLGQRRGDRALAHWKLWDHMDAILSLAVTQLVDQLLAADRRAPAANQAIGSLELSRLDRHQRRDLLLLAACYDQSTAETVDRRWRLLRRKLRYSTWRSHWPLAVGVLVSLAVAAAVVASQEWTWLATVWPYLIAAAGWLPWLYRTARWTYRSWRVAGSTRVLRHEVQRLRRLLARMPSDDLANQPLPESARTDDRYELLVKLQGVLKTLGYSGLIVLVDRVDEPHLINGSNEQMRMLLWPMLDNKFLKHPGLGLKLLLPVELAHYMDREDREFYQRARLDKQNLVPSLDWTGEALLDVAAARLKACALPGRTPSLRGLLDPSLSQQRLTEALRTLRAPRHMFKFMYRLLVQHCQSHTADDPVWQISPATFESTLALYQRDRDAFDRGVGPG